MKLFNLIKEDIEEIVKQYKCKKHVYVKVKTIYGDMINVLGYRSVWKCLHCNKCKRSKYEDKIQ